MEKDIFGNEPTSLFSIKPSSHPVILGEITEIQLADWRLGMRFKTGDRLQVKNVHETHKAMTKDELRIKLNTIL